MASLYLIPCVLAEDATDTIATYVLEAVKKCTVIFAENERTARRFLKSMDKTIVIDDFEWFAIHKAEEEQLQHFIAAMKAQKNIAIISEAGCPGIADPGQYLIKAAQDMHYPVKPLVGPSSILLALMASGMNGQQFEFVGYLPIDNAERIKKIKELEISSQKNNSTKIFIETPYRNNQLFDALIKSCNANTKLCIGINITAANERIITCNMAQWKNKKPDLHKQPVIFLLYAGGY
ncbi:MAG: SAM-dependent methyltransferase [Bacteroidetes bacterium]|nr:SAM-dependent methyltransferase [Bacteroidota bacterium]MBS1757018.1 SAM-dependent methyltransferase [Bacteroidota bacterium]